MSPQKWARDGKPVTAHERALIDEAIRHLDRPSDELADYFASIGCAGDLHGTTTCPVARFLSKRARRTVFVGSSSMSIEIANRPNVKRRLPLGVSAFVRRFDTGQFPELVR